jgi:FKBP-type peptidyl-prolyl cis-trans isomerase FkpA
VELADTLQRKSGGQLPPFLKKKDKISFIFKVLDVFPTEDLLTADRNQELAKEKQREITAVEAYLAQNKINAEKTEKGTYVVVNSIGDGPQVDSNKEVTVKYTGKLFPSGVVFETNVSGPAANQPFKFVVGRGQIITGWDDGLRKFKKGGKGTLYIPAYLAYNDRQGPGHKPYENLIFDVEIVDVADAPPPSAGQPGMPPMQMPQGQRAVPQHH